MYECQMDRIIERINKPARITLCIQAHNEEYFIEGAIKHLYEEVDRIIVIEGAVENRPNQTEDGHSTDKTIDIIRDIKNNFDSKKKITFIQIKRPWKSLEELKQTFFDMSIDGDWLLICDADERYDKKDIARLRTLIDREPNASEVVPLFLHFYRDFKHVAIPAPEWQPQHQRFFKYKRGMKYNSHPIATDANGKCTYFSPEYQHRRFLLNEFYVWHYGYARPNMDEIMKQKQSYYEKELKKFNATGEFDKKVYEFLNKKENLTRIAHYPIEKHPVDILGLEMSSYNEPHYVGKEFKEWNEYEPYKADIEGIEYGNIWLWMSGLNPRMQFYDNRITI